MWFNPVGAALYGHIVLTLWFDINVLALTISLPSVRQNLSAQTVGYRNDSWDDAYERARRTVNRMTLQEKVNISRGFTVYENTCAGNSGSVPRLAWPGLCLHDAGNGVRDTDMVNAYPSGLHVGASWDAALAYQRGLHMGREFRAKGVNVVLGPNAGPLGRTPLGGRNWEGFSIDPYLAGRLTAETIKGQQDAGVITSLKHFIGNEQETYRRAYFGVEAISSNIDDRTFHEYYLWPFMDGVHAGVGSVMCSYNRINGTYACENSQLLNHILKDELAFQGFVLLDWKAQHDLDSVTSGLDMVMPDAGALGDQLAQGVKNGSIAEDRVTDMATRILAAWYRAGQDASDVPPPGIGMKPLTDPHKPIDARVSATRPVLLNGAISGHVLVKNVDDFLPFRDVPPMLSIFGYDAVSPPSKNTDRLFEYGYSSSPEIAQAVLGTEQHFDQAARAGTIIHGGRAGANAPPFIIDPLNALQRRARADGIWLNWDVRSSDPEVNGASSACLVFINAMATEGWDREGLHDDPSDKLVLNVARKCARTIVVIHAAGIRLVDRWIEHANITAVIFAHLPGQDSGDALIRLLFGEANFSGKLPYTVAKNETDYPVYEPCGRASDKTEDPQCEYAEGVYLDYRAFDARNLTPRYEFGFGLSYTRFQYSSLVVNHTSNFTAELKPGASSDRTQNLWDVVAHIQACIANVGSVAGDEIAQLYIGIPNRPSKQLRGFAKVPLLRGAQSTVHFDVTRRDLSIWDVVQQGWVVQSGVYDIYVGASSRDVRLTGQLVVAENGV